MSGTQARRKLISLTGYQGFLDQLRPHEYLEIMIRTFDGGRQYVRIEDEHQFEAVYLLEGEEIGGFFATVKSEPTPVTPKRRIHPPHTTGMHTTASRSTENVALGRISRSKN